MLKTEGVDLRFTDEAVMAIAHAATEANDTVENIGNLTFIKINKSNIIKTIK